MDLFGGGSTFANVTMSSSSEVKFVLQKGTLPSDVNVLQKRSLCGEEGVFLASAFKSLKSGLGEDGLIFSLLPATISGSDS